MAERQSSQIGDTEGDEATASRAPREESVDSDDMTNTNSRRLTHDDYKILWVCTLPSELAAAEAMLDEQHEDLPPGDGDSNRYMLGNIAEHNVVILYLPRGEDYVQNAANAVFDATMSFLSLHWGVMVGVAGAVPNVNNDVRLGDVVVGTMFAAYAPGFTFGTGNIHPAGGFLPDDTLLRVLVKLETAREKNKHTSERMATILRERASTMQGFQHPGLPDHLFDWHYAHAGLPSQDCRQSCDFQFRTMVRPQRPSQRPLIHSGPIISGDGTEEQSDVRDSLAHEVDAICFELEANGPMCVMPLLPIRGICDYSDSHRNTNWQRYAAANAAAYAREVIETLPLVHNRILWPRDLCQEEDNMTRSEARVTAARRERIIDWFNIELISGYRQRAIEPHDDTHQSPLPNKRECLDWPDDNEDALQRQFLWVKGQSGTGKSTIMKSTYDVEVKLALHRQRWTQRSELVLFFSFSDPGGDVEKSLCGMYERLVQQIVEGYPDVGVYVRDVVDASLGESLSLAELEYVFKSSIKHLKDRVLTVFIDASDEGDDRQDIVRMIRQFQDIIGDSDEESGRVRICLSSRHHPNIRTRWGDELILDCLPLHVDELKKYVNKELQVQDTILREELKAMIFGKSKGVFLWTVLAVKEVNSAHFNEPGGDAERKRIHELPAELPMLFRYLITRDSSGVMPFVRTAAWILFPKRPLSLLEFGHALRAMDKTLSSPADLEQQDEESLRQRVINSCHGLAECTAAAPHRFQFIHESVRQFLLNEGGLSQLWADAGTDVVPQCHLLLRDSCLEYIMHYYTKTAEVPARAPGQTNEDYVALISARFPFAKYASEHVFYHANEAARTFPQTEFMARFPVDVLAQCLDQEHIANSNTPRRALHIDLIYMLAAQGCGELIRQLPQPQPLTTGGSLKYPFLAAVAGQHLDAIAAILGRTLESCRNLDIWASIKTRSSMSTYEQRSPVTWAAQEGSLDLLRLLIDLGYDAQEPDDQGLSAFSTALLHENRVCAEYLLSHGLLGRDWDQENPVLACLYLRNYSALERILQNERDRATQTISGDRPRDRDIWNAWMPGADWLIPNTLPLSVAASFGMQEAVRMLLEHGARIEDKGIGVPADESEPLKITPLSYAAGFGRLETVKLLIESGAVFDWTTESHYMPYCYAFRQRNEDVFSYLENLDGRAGNQDPVLLNHYCELGRLPLVIRCVEQGRNVNARDEKGMSPLMTAVQHKHPHVAQYLLSVGADVAVRNERGESPCTLAAKLGDWTTALQLLRSNDTPEERNDVLSHALRREFQKEAETISCVLAVINAGGDIAATGNDEWKTPALVAACRANEAQLARTIVERRGDVNCSDADGVTPLMAASSASATGIALFLHSRGARLSAVDTKGHGVLHYALNSPDPDQNRKMMFLQLLVGLNVDMTGCDKDLLEALSANYSDDERLTPLSD